MFFSKISPNIINLHSFSKSPNIIKLKHITFINFEEQTQILAWRLSQQRGIQSCS